MPYATKSTSADKVPLSSLLQIEVPCNKFRFFRHVLIFFTSFYFGICHVVLSLLPFATIHTMNIVTCNWERK